MSALVSLELIGITCCNEACGVVFGLNNGHYQALKESHGWFTCPNGHRQHFTGKTEAQKLREELDAAKRRTAQAENAAGQERVARAAAEKKLARATKRAHAGTCTHCNRTFQNVARHMATKHAGEVAHAK